MAHAPATVPAHIEPRGDLPATLIMGGRETAFRCMVASDKDAILDFARRQPPHDLLFLRRDITARDDVDGWTRDIEEGTVTTVLAATPDGVVLGYATLDRGDLRWTRHVAEIRVLVDAEARDRGLGRMLLQIAFGMALAAGVEKVMARMTPDQVSARALFEGLGFESEAVLRNHVRDAQGRKHDLVVLSFDTERQELAPCEACGGLAITRLSLEGRQLCWSCYEIVASEIGGG